MSSFFMSANRKGYILRRAGWSTASKSECLSLISTIHDRLINELGPSRVFHCAPSLVEPVPLFGVEQQDDSVSGRPGRFRGSCLFYFCRFSGNQFFTFRD